MRRFCHVLVAVGAAVGWAVPLAASAAPVSCLSADRALGVAAQFTEVVHGDAVRSGTTGGRVLIGGHASLGDTATQLRFTISDPSSASAPLAADPKRLDLIVGGTLRGFGVNIARGGGVWRDVADPAPAVVSAVPGALLGTAKATPFDLESVFDTLSVASQRLSAFPANGVASSTKEATGSQLTLTGDSPSAVVFRITAEQLAAATMIRFRVPIRATAVVNVVGKSFTTPRAASVALWDAKSATYVPAPAADGSTQGQQYQAMRDALVWNFGSADAVVVGAGTWPGMILAANADVRLGGSVGTPFVLQGRLYAKSLIAANAVTVLEPFTGCLPALLPKPAPTTSPSPVPSPKVSPVDRPAANGPADRPAARAPVAAPPLDEGNDDRAPAQMAPSVEAYALAPHGPRALQAPAPIRSEHGVRIQAVPGRAEHGVGPFTGFEASFLVIAAGSMIGMGGLLVFRRVTLH